MILRVLRVLGFMMMRMFGFIWFRLKGGKDADAWLLPHFRAWSDYVLNVFTVDLRIEGKENFPPAGDRKIIIMSNHQSQLDIPCLTKVADRITGFVAKRELSRIPLLHYWMIRIGCVIIDRSDKRGAHLALEKAAREMGSKPLVVFPEGTRSKDGALLPFKLGGTRLSLLAQAVIVPVLIEGSRNAVENRKAKGPGKVPVKVTVFPPFDTRGLDEGKASQTRIKEYVERCWHDGRAPS